MFWLGLGTKATWLWLEKHLEITGAVATNTAGDVPMSSQKYLVHPDVKTPHTYRYLNTILNTGQWLGSHHQRHETP